MRSKSGIRVVAWSAVSFPALGLALALLCAGCDSGGSPSPEAQKAAELQKESAKKILDETNAAAAKKGGDRFKFGGKPGATGGN